MINFNRGNIIGLEEGLRLLFIYYLYYPYLKSHLFILDLLKKILFTNFIFDLYSQLPTILSIYKISFFFCFFIQRLFLEGLLVVLDMIEKDVTGKDTSRISIRQNLDIMSKWTCRKCHFQCNSEYFPCL